jgi:hypothetical protein
LASRYVFLRDFSWALKGYTYGAVSLSSDGDYQRKAVLDYDTSHGTYPLLKRASYWFETGPQHARDRFDEYVVEKFTAGPAPESEFLPSALDLAIGETRVPIWPRTAVLLVGAALIAVYVYLKRRVPA